MKEEEKCKYNINHAGDRIILYIDCFDCEYGGTAEDSYCLKKTFGILQKETVNEISYKKKDFMYTYNRCFVNLLFEIINTIKDIKWSSREQIQKIRECKIDHNDWEKFLEKFISNEFYKNPIVAYNGLILLIKQYEKKHIKERFKECDCLDSYIKLLNDIKTRFDRTKLIKNYFPEGYEKIIKPSKQPSFISSKVILDIPKNAELLDNYEVSNTKIQIYDMDNRVDKLYVINPPEIQLSSRDAELLSLAKVKMMEEHIFGIINPQNARDHFKRMGFDILLEFSKERKINLDKNEIEKLSAIFARYTAGYGLLEILFKDKKIQDIYVDSPPGAFPAYINHERYGICNTNIYMAEDDIERISSKFRSLGGRPFDDANPILDMELRDIGIRVAGIREPSTYDGIAYAFRKHREDPWTLLKFVRDGMMTAKSAALLSFLVSGQRSILVTGPRGSGKTSLLSALISEVNQNDRIVLMEDTPEVPSRCLRNAGWKIEHMRNQTPMSQTKKTEAYELSPEENLWAALRLGESVLILGEVRGPEAKVLFEAMRVGAAGNAILGTIHGSDPYDTWDRVTNDLGVPSTSFKAVNVIVSIGYSQDKESAIKQRQIINITEVRRNWVDDPLEEGFVDIMKYDEKNKDPVWIDFDSSEVIKSVAMRKQMSIGECKKNIAFRQRLIEKIVEVSHDNLDEILELEHAVNFNKEYIRLANEQLKKHENDYNRVYTNWKNWFDGYIEKLEKANADLKIVTNKGDIFDESLEKPQKNDKPINTKKEIEPIKVTEVEMPIQEESAKITTNAEISEGEVRKDTIGEVVSEGEVKPLKKEIEEEKSIEWDKYKLSILEQIITTTPLVNIAKACGINAEKTWSKIKIIDELKKSENLTPELVFDTLSKGVETPRIKKIKEELNEFMMLEKKKKEYADDLEILDVVDITEERISDDLN